MNARSSKLFSHRDRDLAVPLTRLKTSLRARSAEDQRMLVDRIRSEFVEMQGFSPTLEQAMRLFHFSEVECLEVLIALVEEGFLHVAADGRYRIKRRG